MAYTAMAFHASQSRASIRSLFRATPPLAWTAGLMLASLLGSAVGFVWDHRMITGVAAWLKPAKFSVSVLVDTVTLTWIFSYLTVWPMFLRACGWVTAAACVVEIALIDWQAGRGTTSHFNVSTPLVAAIFAIMGLTIACLLAESIVILAISFRQRFRTPVMGRAIRSGVLMRVIGTTAGGMMLRPTSEQRAQLQAGRPISVGAHSVGAPDEGRAVPAIGWNRNHGDLRVLHFIGLHGIQAIPLFALFLRWRGKLPREQQMRLVHVASLNYSALFVLSAWQALQGLSPVQFNPPAFVTTAWAVGTVGTMAWALRGQDAVLTTQAAARA